MDQPLDMCGYSFTPAEYHGGVWSFTITAPDGTETYYETGKDGTGLWRWQPNRQLIHATTGQPVWEWKEILGTSQFSLNTYRMKQDQRIWGLIEDHKIRDFGHEADLTSKEMAAGLGTPYIQ